MLLSNSKGRETYVEYLVVAKLGMIIVGGMFPVLVFQSCQRALLESKTLNNPFTLSNLALNVA